MDIKNIISQMTLEEKAGLCSGAGSWHTRVVERFGIPDIMVSDGPHGLRKQDEQSDYQGMPKTVEAVCFPSGAAMASSFDVNAMHRIGEALGEEAKAESVHTLLGPAINIKRSPLCGRNFEYLSEDPFLAGEMAAAYVNAVQGHGVGTSPKHFAVNNQECRRMSISANVDEQALREIYLAGFETVVKKARPWTMMCSYNRINGVYSCENPWLLEQVLREEWGFDGVVMTDWGAMNRRVPALESGLELEMPSSNGENDKLIVKAVQDGMLQEEVLDRAVERLLGWVEKAVSGAASSPQTYNKENHHRLAREFACESAVLLKNDGLLPLSKSDKIAFIGAFAETPRYQGCGSSHINSYKVTGAVQAVSDMSNIAYSKGFDAESDAVDEQLLTEAVETAKKAKIAVIFAGLPDSYESEGFDRTHLRLPAVQDRLIGEIAAVQPNTVVVLHNGSPVIMPWLAQVNAVLEMYLGGQAVGEAAVDLLFGDANPSGRLAETFPNRLEDTPCYLSFPGNEKDVDYREGVYVGYRHYDSIDLPVLFPFGHGLSYTEFAYRDLTLSDTRICEDEPLTVTVKVNNIGKHTGKEVVQLYVSPPVGTKKRRPVKELKGFAKISLEPGEEKTVSFCLDKRSFAYYETAIGDWHAETGLYQILIGKSSRNIMLKETVELTASDQFKRVIDDTTTFGDVWNYASDTRAVDALVKRSVFALSGDDSMGVTAAEMNKNMLESMPLHSIVSFGDFTRQDIQAALDDLERQGWKYKRKY